MGIECVGEVSVDQFLLLSFELSDSAGLGLKQSPVTGFAVEFVGEYHRYLLAEGGLEPHPPPLIVDGCLDSRCRQVWQIAVISVGMPSGQAWVLGRPDGPQSMAA